METLASIKEWLVSAALVFFGAMVVALCWMRVGNWLVEPFLKAWRKFSPVGRTVFFIAILIATLHAQKPGTNGQQRVGHRPAVTMRHHGHGGHRGGHWFGQGFRHNGSHTPDDGDGQSGDGGMQMMSLLPFADGNSPLVLDESSLAAGFAIARIGTNEVWDFSPSENAVFATNWLRRGAAEDAFAIMPEMDAYTIGTAKVSRLFVSSTGIAAANAPRSNPAVRPIPDESGAVFLAPFRTRLGIVPDFNWPLIGGRESRFWHDVTDTDILRLTWENALYARETNFPVSVRAELHPDGDMAFLYNLSSLTNVIGWATNVTIGVQIGDAGVELDDDFKTTDLTSVYWRRLPDGATATSDDDGDGLTTSDEVLVYGTDPKLADSDFDGIPDGDEILLGLDPLNAYSITDSMPDGLARVVGDLDPFSCPPGSTNTIYEHVFYTGTTNAPFACPESTADTAVLSVSVPQGARGRLAIGDTVVPLYGGDAPLARGADTPTSVLKVRVPKGVKQVVRLDVDVGSEPAVDSSDFAFGVWPRGGKKRGWIVFPNAEAHVPCVHYLDRREERLWLDPGEDCEDLTVTWHPSGEDGQIVNHPPLSATLRGVNPGHKPQGLGYTLSHPRYLFGETEFAQRLRFCPAEPEEDEDDGNETWYPDGYDPSDGSEEPGEHWCCHWGVCGVWCGCGCDCGDADESGDQLDDTDFDDECPEHVVPYDECASLHEDAYTNAVNNVRHLGGVLLIRDPLQYEPIHLEVPIGHRDCCICPDHWTNSVGVVRKSYRLKLVDSGGEVFTRTATSGDVYLAGVHPSSSVGDATLAFARNGEVYLQYAKTVLGVAIKGDYGTDLAAFNALNPRFGFPMTVCTNDWRMSEMRLVTNVKLPSGNVHLELADATGQFTVWYYDRRNWEYRKLLDTDTAPVKDLSLAYWKTLMRRATSGDSPEMPIYISSATPGTVTLKFRYWTVTDEGFVQDEAVQRVTSVLPPLRFDITRDGSIDNDDSESWFGDRYFHYWTNEETVKGDHIKASSDATPNRDDLSVNGTFDLVNFFPAALDLAKFTEAWGNRVTYEIHPQWGNTNSFNFCLADILWREAGRIQTNDVTTVSGQTLATAGLNAIPSGGILIPYSTLAGFSEDSGIMVCEAKSRGAALRLDIRQGDTLLYSYSAPMNILPVKEMYSWYNFRALSGESVVRGSAVHRIHEENNTKSLIFLHGANVSEAEAEKWGDILFKRMWLAGVKADFYNIDWRSNIGEAYNYHANASNAFVVASQIAPVIAGIPNEKIIMAHSLGNMVVSSMIQDHGLQVSKYIMCNSAVPAEAYDPTLAPTNVLVHKDWDDYPRKSFANEWYRLFEDDETDDRRLLTWGGRFADVADCAVNFYSTRDHVLELFPTSAIGASDGYENLEQMYERYSWHKQEIWKGRKGLLSQLGTTDWSGWSIRENGVGYNAIQPTNAWLMSESELRTNTVFKLQPASMNTNSIARAALDCHLTLGLPARTAAAGAVAWGDLDSQDTMFNLNQTNLLHHGIDRPNGWPTRTYGWLITSTWTTEWLHSDIKDVAYFFNFKAFEKIVEEANLK